MKKNFNQEEFDKDSNNAIQSSNYLWIGKTIFMREALDSRDVIKLSEVKKLILKENTYSWSEDKKSFYLISEPKTLFSAHESYNGVSILHNKNISFISTCRRVSKQLKAYTKII